MATILELGYREDGRVFQPLPSDSYTPVYFENWTFLREENCLRNEEKVEFDMNLKEEKEINCVAVNLLPSGYSNTRECFINLRDEKRTLQPDTDTVTFPTGQMRIDFE